MTTILNDEIVEQLKDFFQHLEEPVEIILFSKVEETPFAEQARQLIDEVTAISELLSYSEYKIEENSDLAATYNVDKSPTLVITAKDGDKLTDYGLRFVGIPSGHEFTTLVHGLASVSKRKSDLSDETKEYLKGLEQPLLLQVFVTPT